MASRCINIINADISTKTLPISYTYFYNMDPRDCLIVKVLFFPKEKNFKVFTHNVTVCVVITYLAVFSQAWIDADWIFMFSFRRKLLILEKKRKVLLHSFIIYWFILTIHWNPTMCQAVRNQRPEKNYHPFFSDLWKHRAFVPCGARMLWERNMGFPFKEPSKSIFQNKNTFIFMKKLGYCYGGNEQYH